MRTYAVEFMLYGSRVFRLFVTAESKRHAEVLAARRLDEEYDEIIVTEL